MQVRPTHTAMGTIDYKANITTQDELLAEIKRHNELYRKGEPEITDIEYDALVEKLKVMDPDNEWFKKAEPGIVNTGRKVKLPIPMKSLNKVKNLPDIQAWLSSLSINENETIIVTPKFDGLSLLYSCPLQKAYSRGGIENEGQDCTPHYNMLMKDKPSVPKNISWNCVFGEFVFSREQWETHFAGEISLETGDKYKSPRNTAAGFLNRDVPTVLIQHVDFYRYGIDEYSLNNFSSYQMVLDTLCATYNQKPIYIKVKAGELTGAMLHDCFKSFSELYYIDGLVLYINDLNIWERIGRHQTTGNPLYAIAYKHPDFTDSFQTTVKGVNWKISKSGALKPVVNIEAVDTGDCNMENPTGYNAAWISDNNIAPGAKILVTRSGGVIPKILATLEPAPEQAQNEMWDSLCECPACGSPTAWNASKVELCCTNKQCPGIRFAKMVFFYLTCGAENVGEETLAKIFNAGYTSISQLLNITFDELMNIEGFGESVSNTILENNNKIKSGVDIFTLMHASDCFSGIGKIKAKKLLDDMDPAYVEMFYSMEYPYLIPANQAFDELSITEQAFEYGVPHFYNFIRETGIPFTTPQKQNINANGKYAGMNVCFSGIRDAELEELIVSQGGSIASGVSKKTTHLVVKDTAAASSKITKAKSLGVPILSIDDFRQ